ncbi:YnfA family protein [Methanococcoides seepicolus]|uniref:YnfA family protein n=1 Tax=Methanococcoides seepicolus TaxID=2828780 RepID=A0A9E4ZG70_9EURY|nr:YnfA family protein [Methanococcoides seepicolus]MCM1987001.1 YnfA family protein [Methanococcoides seepicolus]
MNDRYCNFSGIIFPCSSIRNWWRRFGGLILAIYGIIPTFQPAHFGRVYAAYDGIFIVSSLIWGFVVDKKDPDIYEIIGALIALLGFFIMFYMPR